MGICIIPKSIADKLKTELKRGDISLDKLYDMPTNDRHDFFEQYMSNIAATKLNAEFDKSKLAGEKKAEADYVTASQKEAFGKQAGKADFAKKLLNDEQKQSLKIDAVKKQIEKVQEQKEKVTSKMSSLEGENLANAEAKLSKLIGKEEELNLKKEALENPPASQLIKKINARKSLLSPKEGKEYYNDLVETAMGQKINDEQAKYIISQADKLQKLSKVRDDYGEYSAEYFNTLNRLNYYISTLNPDRSYLSIVRDAIEITRFNLVENLATPLKVIESGAINHNIGMLIRRIGSASLGGDNYAYSRELSKENLKFKNETGLFKPKMRSIDDTGTILGGTIKTDSPSQHGENLLQNVENKLHLPDVSSEQFNAPETEKQGGIMGSIQEGFSKTRAISKKVSIDIMHNIPLERIYNNAFVDALNFRASLIAKNEGLSGDARKARGKELMTDANLAEPQTTEGKVLRAEAQQIADHALSIHNSFFSRLTVGIKNALNSVHPDFPIGDLLDPIVKIPANLVQVALRNSPFGLGEAGHNIWKGRIDMKSDDTETHLKGLLQYRNGLEHLGRIIGAAAVAAVFTGLLDQKDFRRDNYGNTFIKIEDHWISTEYLNSISVDLEIAMLAKQGKSLVASILGTVKNELEKLPVGQQITTYINDLGSTQPGKKFGDLAVSRVQPGFVSSFTKKPFRPIDRLIFGAQGFESQQQVNEDNSLKTTKAAATRAAAKKAKSSVRKIRPLP